MSENGKDESGGIGGLFKKVGVGAASLIGFELADESEGTGNASAAPDRPTSAGSVPVSGAQSLRYATATTPPSQQGGSVKVDPERVAKFLAVFSGQVAQAAEPYIQLKAAMDGVRTFIPVEADVYRAGMKVVEGTQKIDIGTVKSALARCLQIVDDSKKTELQKIDDKVKETVGSTEQKLNKVAQDIATLEQQIAKLRESQTAMAIEVTTEQQKAEQRRIDIQAASEQLEREFGTEQENLNRIFP